jgi:hypothetical protein
MILEKNQDLNLKILECLAQALINIKMQSSNMALKCSQAMDSAQESQSEMESKYLNNLAMSLALETINLKNKFFHILAE